MKLFKYTCGDIEKYGVGIDEDDAYARREQVEQTFYFLPVTIEELKVEGYEITVKPSNDLPSDRDELKAWLSSHNIEYVAQWGIEKLREAALQSKAS
jgi:hypothetical protein